MKRLVSLMLLYVMAASFLIGCSTPKTEAQKTAIANPWLDWETLEQAEEEVGFSFGLPEIIGGSYKATAFRTMNKELMEVIYRDGDREARVRKCSGEGQDISGDHNTYDTCTEESFGEGTVATYQNSGSNSLKQVISCNGFSWSVTAPEGFAGDNNHDFVNLILGLS